MPKLETIFICSKCDAQFSKWSGRCLECGNWSTLTEQKPINKERIDKSTVQAYEALSTKSLDAIENNTVNRGKTGINELDRVLGGGFVPGSFILLSGEPGIGKSTLSIQLATLIANTLYISGEESIGQIKLRADRLKLNSKTLKLANATNVEAVIATLEKEKPNLCIVDSIQTISSDEVAGEPGSPTQLKACAVKLMETAKRMNIIIILVGHVTKDGSVAGPKTLEHLVDTVLYLEGDRHHGLRLLRSVKNRFGSTDEIGIFEMKESGLTEVQNPSAQFLSERSESMPGSIITCLLEGSRPILVEIQALINKTSFGYPVRKASGFDINRLHVLIAVLERRAKLNLSQYDVHVNVVGGIKANEPAADLAVALAIASAYKDKDLGKDLAVFGEVGLGGEVRGVRQYEKRMRECEQLGMKRIITSARQKAAGNIKLIGVKNIQDLISHT